MERKNKIRLLILGILLFFSYDLFAQSTPIGSDKWISIISDKCIYDNDNHSAFTSLAEWDDSLYVAFREAGSHMATPSDNGHIRVLVNDNNRWKTHQIFAVDGLDMRDPCFVKWGKRFLLYTSYRYSVLTNNGWSALREIAHNAPHPLYIWKIRPYKDELYGIGHCWNNWPILMKSKDGTHWEVVNEYQIGGNATEADLLFIKNKLYICFRVETPEGSHSWWAESKYPFNDTKWTEMDISVDSPEMIRASNKTILLSGRELFFNKSTRTLERMVTIFAVDYKGRVKGRKVIDTETIDKGYGSFNSIGKNLYQMSYYVGSNKTKVRIVTFSIDEKNL